MLKNKVALVTGAAQGIGKSVATRLAESGAIVFLNDINQPELEKAVKDLSSLNLEVFPHIADISNDLAVKNMMNEIVARHGCIDILVNNAAISIKNPDNSKKTTINITADEWDLVLAVNLKSVFLCSKYAAVHMIQREQGKIINMSSILGKVGCGGDKYDNYHPISSTSAIHYCTSKAGIIGFTRSLARELGKFGINVNAVAPGAIHGGMGKFGNEVIDRMKTQIPLGDLGMQQDIANAVVFLCSEDSKYITGETLNVNGGWLMD